MKETLPRNHALLANKAIEVTDGSRFLHSVDKIITNDISYMRKSEIDILCSAVSMRSPCNVLEVGTCKGECTYYLRINNKNGKVWTVDIDNSSKDFDIENIPSYQLSEVPDVYKVGEYYKDRLIEDIVQIVGDSTKIDYKDYGLERIDIAFVDGNHSENYVYKDALRILKYVAKGSIIFFHDYYENGRTGVRTALLRLLSENRISNITRIDKTSLVYTII